VGTPGVFRRILGTFPALVSRYVVSTDNQQGGNVNAVTLIGNLCTDVEVRELSEERKVANFVIAVDRPGPSKEADFIQVAAWNKQAEVCSRFLAKGKRVAIDGRLRSRSWDDADGKRRSAVDVVARSIQFLSPPEGAGAEKEIPFEAAVAS
jgi:single-strand DNA-binding protein